MGFFGQFAPFEYPDADRGGFKENGYRGFNG
jgi:hypothetical protein